MALRQRQSPWTRRNCHRRAPSGRRPATHAGRPAPYRRQPAAARYFTGTIKCWYGVPAHITYGACVFGSAPFGYMS